MGKPIAGQNQFPYTIGGFLVDGANINGTTYAKQLYIYKQRSYDMYDLQDTDGNIYRFIRLGYKNTSGETLNYFDVDEVLVETIPVNTFFLKIQDPSRSIFSFVRIYQWHKCITISGDYVYRTSNIDPTLSGVLINPTVSTIQVGKMLSYQSLFFPSNYNDLDGNWYLDSIDGINDNKSAQIVFSELNNAIIKGNKIGKSVLSFVPKRNSALVTHSIINIISDTPPLQEFSVQTVEPYTTYKSGEEYQLEIVTYPYDAELTEQAKINIEEAWGNQTVTTLIHVSDDFKFYTFKSVIVDLPITEDVQETNDEPDSRQFGIGFTFSITDPIEYTYVMYNVSIATEYSYNETYDHPGLMYYPPRGLRPNMTWKCSYEISGPNQNIYPYVSSDPDIATFDFQTGILTTYNKTGNVIFSTQYDKLDGSGLGTIDNAMSLTVRDDMYDYISCTPQNVDLVRPGDEFIVTFTGYKEGYDPVNIPTQAHQESRYSVDSNGTVKISPNATNGQIYVTPDITLDYQVISTYNSTGIKPYIRPVGNDIPMTSMRSNFYTYYVRYNEDEKVKNWENIIIYPNPNGCSSYLMNFDSYDDSIIEIIDKDQLQTQSYAMGGSLYFYVKGLKPGSTEMIISSVSNPENKITLYITVY